MNSPGCAGSGYDGGAIGFAGALPSAGCGSGAIDGGDIGGDDIGGGGAAGSGHAEGTLDEGSDGSFSRPKIAVNPPSLGAGGGGGGACTGSGVR